MATSPQKASNRDQPVKRGAVAVPKDNGWVVLAHLKRLLRLQSDWTRIQR